MDYKKVNTEARLARGCYKCVRISSYRIAVIFQANQTFFMLRNIGLKEALTIQNFDNHACEYLLINYHFERERQEILQYSYFPL